MPPRLPSSRNTMHLSVGRVSGCMSKVFVIWSQTRVRRSTGSELSEASSKGILLTVDSDGLLAVAGHHRAVATPAVLELGDRVEVVLAVAVVLEHLDEVVALEHTVVAGGAVA